MSNIKDVEIEAVVPFDWATSLDASDQAMFIAFLNPSFGLQIEFPALHDFKPLPNGGNVARYSMRITGQEAVSFGYLDAMVEIIKNIPNGMILEANVRDIENADQEWESMV